MDLEPRRGRGVDHSSLPGYALALVDSTQLIARLLRGYGLLELPLDQCVEKLLAATNEGGNLAPATDTGAADPLRGGRAEALAFLSHLTHPATRHVLFAVDERWTAVVNNRRDGSGFGDHQRRFGRWCATRSCRVVDDDGSTRRIGPYVARIRYPARIFELADARGDTIRSVHCTLDGDRWDFATHGPALAGEDRSAYAARRKRDRFDSEHLQRLLASLGVTRPVQGAFEAADRFVLMTEHLADERWRAEVEAGACTPEQADDPGYGYLSRGLGWVPHMATHAPSVVSDMTRAVLLNPGLERDARPHLRAARRRLGRREFERLRTEAEHGLRQHGG